MNQQTVIARCLECGDVETFYKDGAACRGCDGSMSPIGHGNFASGGIITHPSRFVGDRGIETIIPLDQFKTGGLDLGRGPDMTKMSVNISIKDTPLFTGLSEVTAFLMKHAEPKVVKEATAKLVKAGIIEDPARLMNDEM